MASQKDQSTVDRRAFLAASAAGAAVVASASSALAKGVTAVSKGGMIGVGSDLGGGWAVQSMGGVEAGALRVVALHARTNRLANLAICRAEAGSHAIASTGAVDLFLMNDGKDGRALTPDDEVALARRLATRLTGAEELLPGAARLLGKTERLQAFDPIDHLEPISE
ncbi:MAG: hypothetical protein H6744_16195 [Deltaproteobacteria bacterium]|nr:hypothetical protein [Deltaproteobacteria bacterium]MCB9788224.1 hypothetical protein [Deltaproteobacteria bacterium]